MQRTKSEQAVDNPIGAPTILIADDDRDLISALELRCRSLGVEVIAVEDALTALSCADFVLPNLVILDVEMPGGNGLAACEMLATDENFAHIPVIILTGRKDDETIRRCQSLGAFYVHKSPNTWTQLEPLIREKLASSPEPKAPAARLLTARQS